jgi:DNA polymerase III epsilon subunit-like protein
MDEIQMTYYIVCDVETSGRHRWYHDVVSCGLVVVDADFKIIDKWYQECSPWMPKHFDDETTAIHGLSLGYLLQQQSSYQMCVNILHFLDAYRDKNQIVYRPFIYHALNRFDFNFMENLFLKNSLEFSFRKMFHREHSFSTLKMARDLGYDSNDLKSWAGRMGEYLDHHNALSDTMVTAKLFRYFMLKGLSLNSGFEIKKSDIIVDASDDVADEPQKKKRKNKKENEVDICVMQNYLQA